MENMQKHTQKKWSTNHNAHFFKTNELVFSVTSVDKSMLSLGNQRVIKLKEEKGTFVSCTTRSHRLTWSASPKILTVTQNHNQGLSVSVTDPQVLFCHTDQTSVYQSKKMVSASLF